MASPLPMTPLQNGKKKTAQKSSLNKLINELTLLWIIKTDVSFSLPVNVDLKTSVFHQFNSSIFLIRACSSVPVDQGHESAFFSDTNAIEKPLMAPDFADLNLKGAFTQAGFKSTHLNFWSAGSTQYAAGWVACFSSCEGVRSAPECVKQPLNAS